MIYEWRCTKCKAITDVTRSVSDMDTAPTRKESQCGCRGQYDRIMSLPHVPFETLRDKGVFERLERFPIL